ncbi:proteasome subunit alpha type protein (macronuclear) [Tetrahymena thermophila SB210]|uniref:Proteasome subunit alpha type n=1 Tax=Tetrahymena thermophila (strain SB210) TaxID=312017 RepID=Q234A8_TETTS|nr:proteasome subunit alpha type protein [Tetrahymena thermophila SB210]EAR92119.1 proteasome subunit alpha type protein [Tetrahymena thermophila SB210]|eukprot:XP_001012340.1 proteasome subunit alpha type protein [Tetrahymena thermophila SB210]
MSGSETQITVFSPEGRLFQVEYAQRAVKNSGITTIGVRGKDCVVLITEKKTQESYVDMNSFTNIHTVSERVGAATTGYYPDSKAIVTRLRQEASEYKLKNGHFMPVDQLSCRLGDLSQVYTQKAFMRPYAVETILAGYDNELGPLLYKNDPSGYFCGYRAVASGIKEQDAIHQLEKEFKKDKNATSMSFDKTIEVAINTLKNILNREFNPTDIEIGVVSKEQPKFKKLNEQEIEEALRRTNQSKQ